MLAVDGRGAGCILEFDVRLHGVEESVGEGARTNRARTRVHTTVEVNDQLYECLSKHFFRV